MAENRRLPKQASVVVPQEGAKLNAPSAERNAGDIVQVLQAYAPSKGHALEIASGTGQHITQFARALPDLQWHPSDIAPERLASVNAWTQEAGLGNVAPATPLNAATPGWAKTHPDYALIVLINLLHLIREDEARVIIDEVAQALTPGGRFILYGPFMRGGDLTSDGDVSFDASLRSADPSIGYKDDFDVIDWLHAAGLSLVEVLEMPANNLCLISERSQ